MSTAITTTPVYSLRLLPNWTTGRHLAQLWKESGQLMQGTRCKLFFLDLDETLDGITPDYWIIINQPSECDEGKYAPEKSIIFYMEPRREDQSGHHGRKSWKKWSCPDPATFLQVRDFNYYPANVEWWLTNHTIESEIIKQFGKVCTAVVSDKRSDKGHLLRLDFLHYAEVKVPGLFLIWGKCKSENFPSYRGELPNFKKDAALVPYKYTFVVENNKEPNYFTEKIVDAIMSECLCFYWGCPNITDYIHPDAFIQLPLYNKEEALTLIQTTMANNEWEKRVNIIKEMKRQIYSRLTLVPTLDNILYNARADILIGIDKVIVINLDKSTDRWNNIKHQFEECGFSNYHRLSATNKVAAGVEVRRKNWSLPTAHLGRQGIDEQSQLGQLGCKISHYRAVALAKKKGWKKVLIMEDDAVFTPSGMAKLNLSLHEAEKRKIQWDLIWVYGQFYATADGFTFPYTAEKRERWLKEQVVKNKLASERCDTLHRLAYSCSTVCYAISEVCYDRVLEVICSKDNHHLPIDDLYCHLLHPILQSFIILPCPLQTDLNNQSTITGQVENPCTQSNVESVNDFGSSGIIMNDLELLLETSTSEPYQIFTFWDRHFRNNATTTLPWNIEQRLASLFKDSLDRKDYWRFVFGSSNQKILSGEALERGLYSLYLRTSTESDAFNNAGPLSEAYTISSNWDKCIEMSGFSCHFINLNRRNDRLGHFLSAWNDMSSNVSVKRFEAIDGQTLHRCKYLEYLFRNNDFGFNRGAMGCAMSHLSLWKQLLEDDSHDAYLIFEDDVKFMSSFKDGRWLQAYYKLNTKCKDWDSCLLAFTPSSTCNIDLFLDQTKQLDVIPLKREMTFGGFSAYWINRKGALKMVKFIDKHGIQNGIDYIMLRRAPDEELDMHNYLVVPNPCFSQWVSSLDDGVDTDIQKTQHPW